MKILLSALIISLSCSSFANEDSLFIRKIYDEALEKGQAHDNLRSLCKDIGARITGSAEAKMAVQWGKGLLESYRFDKVYLQEIQVPHWERGTKEAGWMISEDGEIFKFHMIALGGSVGTDGLIEGDVLAVESIEEMEALGEEKVKGKIVFFNRPFDQKQIQTFRAYGGCIDQRHEGTNAASKLNAAGVIIRSLGSSTDDHPHTGSMTYEAGVDSVAGAAISTKDSDLLNEWLANGNVKVKMEMDCRHYPEETSHNVIAEMYGSKDDQIITFGGHLDSWDVGEGAHDDGAGIVHSIEALRILKHLGYKPKHTLRCVLFMNEENGNFGGKNYARLASEAKEKHLCAIETDRGGFLPIGFDISGTDAHVEMVRQFQPLLKAFQLFKFDPGYSGVDIRPLKEYYPEMIQLGMSISSQRYFDFHHAESDVFENVNKRELHLGAAAMATMIYLLDQNL
ncbi:MAG: carboxypeptidase Q [Arenicella sp.]|jgi:carboxypeptidase Q